jgi:hypothetical protein
MKADAKRQLLVCGCHHKTGTQLLISVLRSGFPEENVGFGESNRRKLPLSIVLSNLSQAQMVYSNIWFEHTVDVPSENIRFLHFVRHPVKWIRSAYLYHRAGGALEAIPWLQWRVFKLHRQCVSYQEVLNCIDPALGLLIESVRSYPEIAGTARAAATSARLRYRMQVSLEQFQGNFTRMARSLYEFFGLQPERVTSSVEALSKHDLSPLRQDQMPPNVTRYDRDCESFERYLDRHPSFSRLYRELAGPMGFILGRPEGSSPLIDDDILDSIIANTCWLLTDLDSSSAQECLQRDTSGHCWLAFAMQQFGEGGHLMMHGFIQKMLDRL